MILGPFFKLVEAVFELIVPLVMADIIDVGVSTGDTGYIWSRGGLMVLLGVVGLGSALVCQFYASRASQGFGTTLRRELFAHMNTLSHAEIDKFGTPSLITRITNDVNQLQVAVAMLIRLVIRAPFLVIGAVVMAVILDWQISVIFLITVPLIALALYFVMSRSIPFYKTLQKKLDGISLITRESLSGARVIRAFSRQGEEQERFDEASGSLTRTAERVGKLSALLNPMTTVIINAAIIAIVWFSGWRVESGGMMQGEIIALVNYMTQIMLALVVVANLIVLFTKASASAVRVNEVLDTQPSIVEQADKAPEVPADAPRIQFEDVSFCYPGSDQYALKGASITIRPGETVGIIGGTGSGKSTLIGLIPRFYDAAKGIVRVDGVDVRDYPLDDLRKKVGMVPQRTVLFGGTVAENLRWGKQDATEQELWQALDTAQCTEFVERLPEKLETPISQGGKNLSGGQKQRLTIARALIARPDILILDDSSSALDFATDAALRRALKAQEGGMTVLMVSQRASSIRHADQILVLDHGEAVGLGTHDQLMESCEVYREICLSQTSGKEEKGA